MNPANALSITPARPEDAALIVALVRELAEYERLLDQVVISAADIHRDLFGPRPYAEAVVAREGDEPVGFALWFHNYSTFAGRPGLYLEDLFVRPAFRGKGYGEALLRHLARVALDRAVPASNGPCSTGTSRRWRSTASWARCRWTNGRCSG